MNRFVDSGCIFGFQVTSLCWKEGTSKSGLLGMKKLADCYKADKRVGLAHISEGIELYICPRSDAIITILAKHGFFKGMFAIEENQDSLIGCVVWRRTKVVTNSVVSKSLKNPSFKEQSPICISDTTTKKVSETDLACIEPFNDGFFPALVAKDGSTPESASSCKSEEKNVELNSLDIGNFLETLTVLSKLASVSGYDNVGPTEKSSEAPCVQTSGPVLRKDPLFQTLPLLSVDAKDYASTSDDDELPEFDFGVARSKFLAENYEKINLPLASRAMPVDFMPALNKRKRENVIPTDDVMKLPRLVKVSEDHPSIRERIAQNRALIRLYGAASDPTPRNHFDERPVWGLPQTAHQRIFQSTAATLVHSELPISTRAFTYTDTNFGFIPAQARRSDEFDQMAFRTNPADRPQAHSFDNRSPRLSHHSRVLKL
ncbi:hypothetical protein ACFE04_003535 [Oxalis oulophora]